MITRTNDARQIPGRYFLFICSLLVAFGCFSIQIAHADIDPSRFAEIDSIAVLPVILDTDRTNSESRQALVDQVRKRLALEVALRGYVLKNQAEFLPGKALTDEDVKKMSIDELALLGPPDKDYILLMRLNSRQGDTFGSVDPDIVLMSGAAASATLIDKQAKEVLWSSSSDTYDGDQITFIDTSLWLETLDVMSIDLAFQRLFESFPEKPY